MGVCGREWLEGGEMGDTEEPFWWGLLSSLLICWRCQLLTLYFLDKCELFYSSNKLLSFYMKEFCVDCPLKLELMAVAILFLFSVIGLIL